MANNERPVTTGDEIDRTGRDEQVTGKDGAPAFGTPGTPAEEIPPGLENDVA